MKFWLRILLFSTWLSLSVGASSAFAQNASPEGWAQPAASNGIDAPLAEYRLPPDKLAKAEPLYRTRVVLYVIGSIYGVAVLVLVLGWRFSARFRDLAERASARRFVQALVFTPLLILAVDALSLPLSVYSQHLRLSYELSVQTWGSWLWDWVKGELVGIVISVPMVWGLYAILRRSPKRWWLYGWLASVPVVLLLVFIQPLFVDPLFNHFEPLAEKQPQLLSEIEKVMARGGLSIERSRMFEMRASDKVTTYNAYVTGIGASKRVVVWDNTARDLTIPETLFVFGHEQGHYVLHHIWWTLGFAIVGLLLGFYALYRVIDVLIARYSVATGIRSVSDWASLPLMLLLLNLLGLLVQPISSAYSRYLEHQADIYGLEVIHGLVPDSSQVAARAFQKLGEKGLAYPSPNAVYVWWAFDHPTIADRVRFALAYRPWDQARANRFVRAESR